MDSYHEDLAYIIKECGKAEKAWADHMKQPEYCLKRNYVLYKKYIRLFNLLLAHNKTLNVDNTQSSLNNYV